MQYLIEEVYGGERCVMSRTVFLSICVEMIGVHALLRPYATLRPCNAIKPITVINAHRQARQVTAV